MTTARDPLYLETEGEWHLRSDGDGRTVTGRIVPFLEPATVVERGERFTEQFLPGCLTAMMQHIAKRGNPGYVTLNIDHDESMDKLVGYARSLEVRDDGGYAEFALYPDRNLDKVRSMLSESHKGLSVMFRDVAAPKEIDGVRSRVQISVEHVAATAVPVYAGAGVTGLRDTAAGEAPSVEMILGDRPALTEWQQFIAEQALNGASR